MKQRGYPLWLLRDVPAFMGFMLSFWTLVIVSITRAAKAVAGCARARDTISLLLAHAEARLDYAFMRQAYRLCGLDPRAVKLHIIPPTTLWSDTQQRLNNYGLAFENMNRVVACHVEDLRAKYRISERDLVTHGSTDARLCRAAHHELVGASRISSATAPLVLILSGARSARSSKDERGHTHARAPPSPHLKIRSRYLAGSPARTQPHVRQVSGTVRDIGAASMCRHETLIATHRPTSPGEAQAEGLFACRGMPPRRSPSRSRRKRPF